MQTLRLAPNDLALARTAFAMMETVFEAEAGATSVSDSYLDHLLRRADLWALAAVEDGTPVGALTAHALPMTRAETTELFIYDLAVRPDWQRRGVGRALVRHLLDAAADAGIDDVFVPAEDEDTHALDFYRAVGGTAQKVTMFLFTAVRHQDS